MKKEEILEKYLSLKLENQELKERLSAKKYRMVDSVFVFLYKYIPFLNKIKNKNHKNHNTVSEKINVETIKEEKIKRKFIPKKVYLINYRFFDYNGEVVYKGGAERYVYDLSLLLKKLGFKPILMQLANKDFEKNVKGLKVVGIKAPEDIDASKASKIYNKLCKDAEFIIASPMELSCEIKNIPIISINHGINFDAPCGNIFNIIKNNIYNKAIIRSSQTVCVDTNFINWVRTVDYDLSNNLSFIPNYYDSKEFSENDRINNGDKLIFVYPRRIYSARGYDITIDAFKPLLEKYKKIELHFVGQIDNDRAGSDLKELMKNFPNQVKRYDCNPEDMPKIYKYADVVLIPTRYSEGTSLSCIEAMASGCAVISSHVGGLTNLVIDNYNGFLVAPRPENIQEAAEKLIKDANLRKKMSKNGVEMAKNGFTKTLWDERWTKIIKKVIKA